MSVISKRFKNSYKISEKHNFHGKFLFWKYFDVAIQNRWCTFYKDQVLRETLFRCSVKCRFFHFASNVQLHLLKKPKPKIWTQTSSLCIVPLFRIIRINFSYLCRFGLENNYTLLSTQSPIIHNRNMEKADDTGEKMTSFGL